jgi:hypothetical protein
MKSLLTLLCALFLFQTPVVLRAEVVATFYSHDMKDNYFPHAYIRLQGTVDQTGETIDTNYGFTAQKVSPAILLGSVNGMIETKDAKYIARSDAHFSRKLSADEYKKLLSHVEKWRNLTGKSYNLNKRNCVHFVMEAAALLGISVNRKSKYFKKPKTFLIEVRKLNPDLRL